ncbi:MAG: alpha/beta hydrolase [Actinomycetota bacterium]|nr:alpha/beta hydrolase [Actinomycetota bacterium]
MADRSPRRDVLLFLTGGPGQTGVGFAPIVADDLAPLLDEYRLVMIDQRGTGERAIDCPELQGAVGASDLLTASSSAVRACAKVVGKSRGFYTTADTVADLDALRRALRAREWVVNGVSYGSFVAQRYAIAHPDHVRALVLDSVVPPDGLDTFLRVNLRRSAYVLRDVCREDPPCLSDPAKDLAKVIREGVVDNVGLLHALTLQSIVDPSFREMADAPGLLLRAAQGDASGLEEYIERFRAIGLFPADELSAGAHVATLCADLRFPWGDAGTPMKQRRSALARAARRIKGDQVWPFDPKTAASHGMIKSCLDWPPVSTRLKLDAADLPDIPVLLLHGERDLSTPMAWAREAARAWPDARLVEIPNDGHSVQTDGTETLGGRVLTRFLRDL